MTLHYTKKLISRFGNPEDATKFDYRNSKYSFSACFLYA